MRLLFRAVLLLALLDPLRCRESKNNLPKGGRVKGRTVKLFMDPAHTPRLSPPSSAKTANLSVSPWVYRTECVDSRVPRCLSHAHCLTSGCVNPESGREDLSLEAKPIYYQLLVLHRVPRRKARRGKAFLQKRYDFRLGSEVVSVGCTCVTPNMLPHN
ncbi:interleukin 17a/f3 [Eucyclogobius newberryi]|uniref:interleukin 17a/f3 n=1 Tax=Eucyclogobius newberryi TaxID=166745 RepID=UPI003B5CCFA4